jgi:hypothetical protein
MKHFTMYRIEIDLEHHYGISAGSLQKITSQGFKINLLC